MKERPIIFTTDSVRAILDGRKSMTRCVMKPQPPEACADDLTVGRYYPTVVRRDGEEEPGSETFGVYCGCGAWGRRCPYGQPGERLWVREAWMPGVWEGYDAPPNDGRPYDRDNQEFPCWYKATEQGMVDAGQPHLGHEFCDDDCPKGWRSPIHMPHWASRLTLEITDVRVERVQEIADATTDKIWREVAAGGYPHQLGSKNRHWIEWFAHTWDSLNAKRGFGWDTNPWVWVLTFKRIP